MRLTDEQIGAELYALRSTPSEDFAAELDAWAEAGFPSVKQIDKAAGAHPPRRSVITRRPVLSAFAAACVIVGVIAISVAGYLHERNSNELFSGSGNDSSQELSGSSAIHDESLRGSASSGIAGSAPSVSPAPPGSRPRNGRAQIQEVSAALGLSTDADKVQGAADDAVDVTNRYDGFVDSSDIHVGGPRSRASFSLRIPATELRSALDDLSDLGRVVSRDEGSANVTGAYVDTGKAYRDARGKVDALVAQLRASSSPTEAQAIRQQLIPARQQLAAARAAVRGIKQRVTYAPVTVQIRAGGDGNWSIGDAANDAGDILKAIAGGTLVTLAVLVPLAALLALGWLGTSELNRRRREAYLDH
jgi:hypothetical protein